MGDRLENLRKSVALLSKRCLSNVIESVVLETKAILPNDAPASWDLPYLNMIVTGNTDVAPHELLVICQQIERDLGRPSQYQRMSPRVIDIDILLYEGVQISGQALTIPHPAIHERPFIKHLMYLVGLIKDRMVDCDFFTRAFVLKPKLVGIVNVTPDSFSDGGAFMAPDAAARQVRQLIASGASLVELGGQSTRPGSVKIAVDKELSRLVPVLDLLKSDWPCVQISIDTFDPCVALEILDNYSKVSWINDVLGNYPDEQLRQIAKRGVTFCATYNGSYPVLNKLAQMRDRLLACGFTHDKIVLDPGIGFGKSAYQSIATLRSAKELKALGCQIMIGHSRKSYLTSIAPKSKPHDLDLETIGCSVAIAPYVDWIRVHDVQSHMRVFSGTQICRSL